MKSWLVYFLILWAGPAVAASRVQYFDGEIQYHSAAKGFYIGKIYVLATVESFSGRRSLRVTWLTPSLQPNLNSFPRSFFLRSLNRRGSFAVSEGKKRRGLLQLKKSGSSWSSASYRLGFRDGRKLEIEARLRSDRIQGRGTFSDSTGAIRYVLFVDLKKTERASYWEKYQKIIDGVDLDAPPPSEPGPEPDPGLEPVFPD